MSLSGRGNLAAHLLGTRVLGREQAMSRACQRFLVSAGRFGFRLRAGDAEVQEARRAVGAHEDVAGLQVTVHESAFMGVCDSLADADEEPQALLELEPRGERIRALALHELHDEVGLTLLRRTAIQEAGNVLVVESRQGLALAHEAPYEFLVRASFPQELHGHLALVLTIGAPRHEDLAHASAPDGTDRLVGAEAAPIRRARARRRFGILAQKATDPGCQLRVAGVELLELARPRLVGELGQVQETFARFFPA